MILGNINVTVNLLGNLTGNVKHTTTQVNTVVVLNKVITTEILHTDKTPTKCTRNFTISEEVTNSWVSGACPSWEEPRNWKNYSDVRRLTSYVNQFDEGYGVSYEFVEKLKK